MTIDINDIDEKLLQEDDRIDAYLRGQMSEEEERAFMQELTDNPELKERAIAIARLAKGLKQVGTTRDKEATEALRAVGEDGIAQLAKETIKKEKEYVDSPKAKVVPLRRLFAIAASVALLIWMGIGYHDYRKTTALADEYADAFGTSQLARGAESTEVEQHLDSLFRNIATKTDMKSTLRELHRCWELSTSGTYNDYTDYSAEIGWHLAVGYLRNYDKKQAKAVLQKMEQMYPEGTAVGDEVRLLNGKL